MTGRVRCYCSSQSAVTAPVGPLLLLQSARCYCSSRSAVTAPAGPLLLLQSARCYCSSRSTVTAPACPLLLLQSVRCYRCYCSSRPAVTAVTAPAGPLLPLLLLQSARWKRTISYIPHAFFLLLFLIKTFFVELYCTACVPSSVGEYVFLFFPAWFFSSAVIRLSIHQNAGLSLRQSSHHSAQSHEIVRPKVCGNGTMGGQTYSST